MGQRERIPSRLHAQCRARGGAQSHNPGDHDLSQNQKLDTQPAEPSLTSSLTSSPALSLGLSETSTNLKRREKPFVLVAATGSFRQLLKHREDGSYLGSTGSDRFSNGGSLVEKTSPEHPEATVKQQVLSPDHGLRSPQGYFQLLICDHHLFLVVLPTLSLHSSALPIHVKPTSCTKSVLCETPRVVSAFSVWTLIDIATFEQYSHKRAQE